MKTYQVNLPDEFAAFVDQAIESGKWDSVNGLVISGLATLMSELQESSDEDVESLRAALRPAIEQADRGEVIDGELVMARAREQLKAAQAKAS